VEHATIGAQAGVAEFQHSPFFSDQLTAFEVWLDMGSHEGSHEGDQKVSDVFWRKLWCADVTIIANVCMILFDCSLLCVCGNVEVR
jgi:hypothetical protein